MALAYPSIEKAQLLLSSAWQVPGHPEECSSVIPLHVLSSLQLPHPSVLRVTMLINLPLPITIV